MKRQRLFCRCAAVVAQVVVDKETHLQLSMIAIDGGEGQLWVKVRSRGAQLGRPLFLQEPTLSGGHDRSERCQADVKSEVARRPPV
jgi:hypothetical protein